MACGVTGSERIAYNSAGKFLASQLRQLHACAPDLMANRARGRRTDEAGIAPLHQRRAFSLDGREARARKGALNKSVRRSWAAEVVNGSRRRYGLCAVEATAAAAFAGPGGGQLFHIGSCLWRNVVAQLQARI